MIEVYVPSATKTPRRHPYRRNLADIDRFRTLNMFQERFECDGYVHWDDYYAIVTITGPAWHSNASRIGSIRPEVPVQAIVESSRFGVALTRLIADHGQISRRGFKTFAEVSCHVRRSAYIVRPDKLAAFREHGPGIGDRRHPAMDLSRLAGREVRAMVTIAWRAAGIGKRSLSAIRVWRESYSILARLSRVHSIRRARTSIFWWTRWPRTASF
jgi:hypothetical protein